MLLKCRLCRLFSILVLDGNGRKSPCYMQELPTDIKPASFSANVGFQMIFPMDILCPDNLSAEFTLNFEGMSYVDPCVHPYWWRLQTSNMSSVHVNTCIDVCFLILCCCFFFFLWSWNQHLVQLLCKSKLFMTSTIGTSYHISLL